MGWGFFPEQKYIESDELPHEGHRWEGLLLEPKIQFRSLRNKDSGW